MLLRTGKAAKYIGVHGQTLRRYANDNTMPFILNNANQRLFSTEDLDAFVSTKNPRENKPEKSAFYIRSSDGDKTLLNKQKELLTEKYGDPEIVIIDKGSGLNDKRPGLLKLIKLSDEQKITTIYITHKDRLTRFGYDFLELIFNKNNVKIVVLNTVSLSPEQELMQDFMNLIASFSGKFYRMRSTENKKKLLNKAQQELNNDQPS